MFSTPTHEGDFYLSSIGGTIQGVGIIGVYCHFQKVINTLLKNSLSVAYRWRKMVLLQIN